MALIRLQDIGKIYVSEGNVAVGIRGVNLSFESGEFVAITGASGSGKSTLLNVISGMDSYEEGELYINEQPTSHYVQSDWEEYRKKYISFIFQEYNIVDSFTVLQNVELALMHIKNVVERRSRALELIERVGLSDHIHQKGSKLSGGQKQRTVIARALAKDSPVILADEPTGNLDSKSSEEIINLLREISANKLVIIVTHNFEEVEHCATRVIRVFDGAIESDRKIPENIVENAPAKEETPDSPEGTEFQKKAAKASTSELSEEELTPFQKFLENLRNGIHLGIVRFLSKPKLAVFLSLLMFISILGSSFITAVSSDAFTFKKTENVFNEMDGRLIVTANDGKYFSDEKLAEIAKAVSAKDYMHYDFLLDKTIQTWDDNDKRINYICRTNFNGKPDVGRLPEKENEVMLSVPIKYIDTYGRKTIKVKELSNIFFGVNYTVVGVHYFYDNTKPSVVVLTPEAFKLATTLSLFQSTITLGNTWMESGIGGYATEEYVGAEDTGSTDIPISRSNVTVNFDIPADSFYIVPPMERTLTKAYGTLIYSYPRPLAYHSYQIENVEYSLEDSKCLKELTPELQKIADLQPPGTVILGTDIVNSVIQKYYDVSYTQASLFFSSNRAAENAIPKLRELGFTGIMSNATRSLPSEEIVFGLLGVILTLFVWVAIMFFIAMFLNLCSKKAMLSSADDIAIMRSMGITGGVIQISIYVQMLMAAIPALIASAITFTVVFLIPKTNGIFSFLHAKEYLLIGLGVIVISLRMANRYVKKMFSSTVKKTLKGGLEK